MAELTPPQKLRVIADEMEAAHAAGRDARNYERIEDWYERLKDIANAMLETAIKRRRRRGTKPTSLPECLSRAAKSAEGALTMSDVKIMREHRLAALQALGWSDAAKAEAWLESGGDTLTHANKFVGRHVTSMVEESAVALAIAQAEHRTRAAVIARLRGLLEREALLFELEAP